jgi:anaerobic magnesium-protoporphyrin IX monomethyl ester cyclase
MKFLLLRPAYQEEKNNQKNISSLNLPPLGLLYMGATLERDGHDVEILDYYAENISKEKLKNSIALSDAIGLSVYTDDYKAAADTARLIKEIDSDIPLIIGGPHCTFLQKKSLEDISYADISVIGEGEQVILNLARYLQGKKKLSNISGIYYKENGSIISGKPLEIIKNLDDLPFPARHLVEKYDYSNFSFGYTFKGNVANLITSKGCPFQCRFCSRYGNLIKNWSFRKRSAENVVSEIQEISEKYKSIVVVDDNFLADNKRAHKIFDMLLISNIDIEFLIEGARVDSSDKELYLKMKKAGVKYIFYGLESGNQDVLDFYNKNITIQQIRNTTALARKMDFFIGASFIFGAPIETKAHIENTIKFACSLPLDRVNFVPLIYRMGSSLWIDAVNNKKIKPDQYEVVADSSHNLSNFSLEELIEHTTNAFNSFYLRPSYIMEQTFKTIKRKDYSLLINGLKYFISFNKAKETGKEIIKSKNIK